jgi:hypothetical protein
MCPFDVRLLLRILLFYPTPLTSSSCCLRA